MRIAGTKAPRQRSPRKPDYGFRRHIATLACLACGRTNATVAAHIRHGHEGGIAYKPDDALCLPLCNVRGCAAHEAFDTNQKKKAKELLGVDIDTLKEQRREYYRNWKQTESPENELDTGTGRDA